MLLRPAAGEPVLPGAQWLEVGGDQDEEGLRRHAAGAKEVPGGDAVQGRGVAVPPRLFGRVFLASPTWAKPRPHSIECMSGDLALFGDDQPQNPAQPVSADAPIADWLVDSLKEALTARGLASMAERQQAIEAVAGRPVDSLRSLTRAEALRALSQLTPTTAPQARSTSTWDDRDEDTWIDRL